MSHHTGQQKSQLSSINTLLPDLYKRCFLCHSVELLSQLTGSAEDWWALAIVAVRLVCLLVKVYRTDLKWPFKLLSLSFLCNLDWSIYLSPGLRCPAVERKLCPNQNLQFPAPPEQGSLSQWAASTGCSGKATTPSELAMALRCTSQPSWSTSAPKSWSWQEMQAATTRSTASLLATSCWQWRTTRSSTNCWQGSRSQRVVSSQTSRQAFSPRRPRCQRMTALPKMSSLKNFNCEMYKVLQILSLKIIMCF